MSNPESNELLSFHTSLLSRSIENLNVLTKPSHVTVSVDKFERLLMPVLAAWAIKGDGEFLHVWIDLLASSGGQPNLNATIDVVKEGKVLFVVPPIYLDYNISSDSDSAKVAKKVTDMVSEVNLRLQNGEARAVMTLDSTINGLLDDFSNNVEYLRSMVLLGKVWKHYDLNITQVLGEKLAGMINLDDFDMRGNLVSNTGIIENTQSVETGNDDGGSNNNEVEYIL